jgi:hypothetical protein
MTVQTTLILDDDLVSALKEAIHGSGLSFEEMVNRALRAGLAAEAQTLSSQTCITRQPQARYRPRQGLTAG